MDDLVHSVFFQDTLVLERIVSFFSIEVGLAARPCSGSRNKGKKCDWTHILTWAEESLVRLNAETKSEFNFLLEWRVTSNSFVFLQTELENEHCFEVVHRRQMFIIVSLFQRIILCWPAGKIICSSRKEPIIHKSSDWRPVFRISDDHGNRKHNKNGLK